MNFAASAETFLKSYAAAATQTIHPAPGVVKPQKKCFQVLAWGGQHRQPRPPVAWGNPSPVAAETAAASAAMLID